MHDRRALVCELARGIAVTQVGQVCVVVDAYTGETFVATAALARSISGLECLNLLPEGARRVATREALVVPCAAQSLLLPEGAPC
jgi:hypothetical protein